jgi:HSP20 family protein
MATDTAVKAKPQQEAPRSGTLARSSEFPFFLSRMRDEFDRLFERFSRQWPSLWQGNGWRWGLDVRDSENAIVVEAEAPGFEPGDFDLQMTDNRLILRAAKKVETKGEAGKDREYRQQECYESVTLPSGIDKDKVQAKYHNGVLTVTLPKTAEGKSKRIAVKVS